MRYKENLLYNLIYYTGHMHEIIEALKPTRNMLYHQLNET